MYRYVLHVVGWPLCARKGFFLSRFAVPVKEFFILKKILCTRNGISFVVVVFLFVFYVFAFLSDNQQITIARGNCISRIYDVYVCVCVCR